MYTKYSNSLLYDEDLLDKTLNITLSKKHIERVLNYTKKTGLSNENPVLINTLFYKV